MTKLKKAANDRKLMDRIVPDVTFGRLLGVLATTYEMQAEFFEADFLPTLLGLGAWDDRSWTSRIAIEKHLAELDTATFFLDARPYRGRPRSLRVEVKPVHLDHGQVLHAKCLVLAYQHAIRLIVGSANLTEPGYRRNREVAAVLTATAKQPRDASLIAQALSGMTAIASPWMTESARELLRLTMERLGEWGAMHGETNEWFVWGGGDVPLWRQFLNHWPSTEIVRVATIVSPFWSEETPDGPISTFVTHLRTVGCLATNAELRLLTDAAPDKQNTYKPKLPESFRTFDAAAIDVRAFAGAVDPRVPPEEVGLGEEFTGTRSLHAKVVLLEGPNTSLAYIGSANFTNRGWGFLSDPSRSNIEAGIVLRRSGSARDPLRSVLPPTTGKLIPLAGAAAGCLALPDPSTDELPWPAFLDEVVLIPTASDPDTLELCASIATTEVAGSWEIRFISLDEQPSDSLFRVDSTDPSQSDWRVPLSEQSLSRLLRDQEVHVIWWSNPNGRNVPLNIAPSARAALPISPGTGRLQEQQLLAYYQGRITWEDLFPDPEGPKTTGKDTNQAGELSGVDTSRIQSYVVREFVEALKGISDDLRAAAQSSKACMRLALLGPVSPVALARQVCEASNRGVRTATATGFQLVEILGCLAAAREFDSSPVFRTDWLALVDEATSAVDSMLQRVQVDHPDELSGEFRRYAKSIRRSTTGKATPA